MPAAPVYAPGARLLIRDEEWLVKNTLPIRTGGAAVRVLGLSELVRNREAVFLTDLEDIAELKPEETSLAVDDSPQYRRTRLYIESLLRRTPPTDDRIYLGHRAAVNEAPYQLLPAEMALSALRPRILIADGVGLGKTIEVGILLSELIKRGRGERILVIAIRSMLAQFQQELWARFTIPLVRLDSVGLQRVRARIPSNKNPFYYYNRVIISVDTLKNDAQYRHYLEQSRWDAIVIDECQNVANAGSQRHRLANLLARTCDSLILTSATPHNGQPESFANLMNMLDPTAIADASDYTAADIQGLFVRRFKKDIEQQVAGQFSERQVELVRVSASTAEEDFFFRLATATFHTLDRGRSHDELYRVGLLKGFLSSPDACLQTIDNRLRQVEQRLAKLAGGASEEADEPTDEDRQLAWLPEVAGRSSLIDDLEADRDILRALRDLAAAVWAQTFSKYQQLLSLLARLGADGSPGAPRVLIFTERIATLHFLQEHIREHLSIPAEAIPIFHAGLADVEQTAIVESFGKADSPIRILLASDVASEGVNLHYYCHLLIHFDVPWSLITLEQRNGRIDRYGQGVPPLIHYLLTVSEHPEIRGDLRVLDRLIAKEQEAHKNIGDAATILGLYDASQEEAAITQGVAAGRSAEEIIPDRPVEVDWLALLAAAAPAQAADRRAEPISLYPDDLAFARQAFADLDTTATAPLSIEYHPHRPQFTLTAPEDLRRRCEFIPQEAIPADWGFRLSTDRERVKQAIADARTRQGEWPAEQLFWELHPVMDWLLDRVLVSFGRHEAPAVLSPRLPTGDMIYLFQGILSNQRSQPVISDWFGVHVTSGRARGFLTIEEVMEHSGFAAGLSNPQELPAGAAPARDLLPHVLEAAVQHMTRKRSERAAGERKRLREDMQRLDRWREASLARIDADAATAIGARAARLANQRREVESWYADRKRWIRETFTTVDAPYLRLAAVFVSA